MNDSNVNINISVNKKNIKSPIVLSSPHSGTFLPEEYLKLSNLNIKEIKQNEDSLVDELLSFKKKYNNTFISTNWSRGVVDVNRCSNDFIDNDFSSPLINFESNPTKYALSGLGVIPTKGFHNKKIYSTPISGDLANYWIKTAWSSFHENLRSILTDTKNKYGYNVLLDFHSMPSNISYNKNIDVVIGDCFGKSSSIKLVKYIRKFFTNKNYQVNLNKPFSGGFITKNYGEPEKNSHAIQIEINRSLYIDERTRKKNVNFKNIRNLFKDLIEDIEVQKDKLLI